ncbi:hypothetical protein TWF694_002933 [Orbilia ellipsospora]|uniref:Uncharacterized protein n=1 Tax=Orbilia ellipsospora TaxID=2528407 RepID=A0AAV9X050_9PEZI
MTYNYSLLSIAATWAISMGVHGYAVYVVRTSGVKIRYDNANPRNQWDRLKAKLPAEAYARSERAQAASANGLEVLGLWGLAVIAANVTKVPVSTLNKHSLFFIASRILYSILYCNISTLRSSPARSIVWLAGIATAMRLLWKASSMLQLHI